MNMNHIRRGSGAALVLVHGLGGSSRSWSPVIDDLATEREVIAVDLPGFGDTPPLASSPTIAALTDALRSFLDEHDLAEANLVGSSMGARMVLELARRGHKGNVVALDPGGFWNDREVRYFQLTLGPSIRLVRALAPVIDQLAANPIARTALLGQISARPWALPANAVANELRGFATSPSMDDAFHELVNGPRQEGASTTPGSVVIGWGRRDGVTLPRQAKRAQRAFPGSRLEWFDSCGHFPHWDAPQAATRLILQSTA